MLLLLFAPLLAFAEPLAPVVPAAAAAALDPYAHAVLQAAAAAPGGALGVVLLGLLARPMLRGEVESAVRGALDSADTRERLRSIVREELLAMRRSERTKRGKA